MSYIKLCGLQVKKLILYVGFQASSSTKLFAICIAKFLFLIYVEVIGGLGRPSKDSVKVDMIAGGLDAYVLLILIADTASSLFAT
jgi:hypothetical protein